MVVMSEREQLACLVQQWNENRLDLFHLSYPTEDLEVEGVMRFYYQVSVSRSKSCTSLCLFTRLNQKKTIRSARYHKKVWERTNRASICIKLIGKQRNGPV